MKQLVSLLRATLMIAIMVSSVSCDRVTKNIGGGYQLMYLHGKTVNDRYYLIIDNSGQVIVPERIDKIGRDNNIVFGHCIEDLWPPDNPDSDNHYPPRSFTGYFLLDIKSKVIHLELTESDFRTLLKQKGIGWPPLIEDPTKWLR